MAFQSSSVHQAFSACSDPEAELPVGERKTRSSSFSLDLWTMTGFSQRADFI